MLLFANPFSMALGSLLSLVAVLLLFARRPLGQLLPAAGRYLLANRRALFWVLATLATLLMNYCQLLLEEAGLRVGYDLTPWAATLGGSWVASLQQALLSPTLTGLLTYLYVVLFPVLLFGSLLIYAGHGDGRAVEVFCRAIIINYLVALPFYVLTPVAEAWFYQPEIRHLMLTVWPGFEESYRATSGLYHCFPSLHTSLAFTMAGVAWRTGYRRFGGSLFVVGALVVFSIFYLGIHWPIDAVAGLLLAWVAVALAHRQVLKQARWPAREQPVVLRRA